MTAWRFEPVGLACERAVVLGDDDGDRKYLMMIGSILGIGAQIVPVPCSIKLSLNLENQDRFIFLKT